MNPRQRPRTAPSPTQPSCVLGPLRIGSSGHLPLGSSPKESIVSGHIQAGGGGGGGLPPAPPPKRPGPVKAHPARHEPQGADEFGPGRAVRVRAGIAFGPRGRPGGPRAARDWREHRAAQGAGVGGGGHRDRRAHDATRPSPAPDRPGGLGAPPDGARAGGGPQSGGGIEQEPSVRGGAGRPGREGPRPGPLTVPPSALRGDTRPPPASVTAAGAASAGPPPAP